MGCGEQGLEGSTGYQEIADLVVPKDERCKCKLNQARLAHLVLAEPQQQQQQHLVVAKCNPVTQTEFLKPHMSHTS